MLRRTLFTALLLGIAATLGLGSAQARDHVSVSVSTPEFGIRVGTPHRYYQPAPVYVAPAPVYYSPPPVYYAPRVVYPAPVYYGDRGYGHRRHYHGNRHWHGGDGHHRGHHRGHRHGHGHHGH